MVSAFQMPTLRLPELSRVGLLKMPAGCPRKELRVSATSPIRETYSVYRVLTRARRLLLPILRLTLQNRTAPTLLSRAEGIDLIKES